MTTYFFPDCRLDVYDSGETTAYFSSSGCILERLPRPVEDRPTARLLGYGADTKRFRREHDLLLHTIAVLRGFGCSPMLWGMAHAADAASPDYPQLDSDDEEALGACVHRWLNLDVWSDEIGPLLNCGMDRGELRGFLRAVLEGEITRIDTPIVAMAA